MTDRDTLKPCPFCGRDDSDDNATQEACVILASFKSPAGGRAHRVECCCGAVGAAARFAEEAIVAWNTRALSTAKPDREAIARAAYEAHVKRNKPW